MIKGKVMKNILMAVVILSGILVNCSQKGTNKSAPMEVENVAVLEVPSVQKTTAVFMTIRNNSADDDFLIGAQADIAEACEMHEMVMEGEVMRMQKLDSVEIPAGGSVEFKQGGLHLMLINLKREIKTGESIKIMLKFKNSNEVEVTGMVHPLDHMHEHMH